MNSIRSFVDNISLGKGVKFLGLEVLALAYALDGELLEKGLVTYNQFPKFPFYYGEYSLGWVVIFEEKPYLVYEFRMSAIVGVRIVLREIVEGRKLPVGHISDNLLEQNLILSDCGPKMQLANCPCKTLKWLQHRLVTKRTIKRIMQVTPRG
jgi:hypothetical protein